LCIIFYPAAAAAAAAATHYIFILSAEDGHLEHILKAELQTD